MNPRRRREAQRFRLRRRFAKRRQLCAAAVPSPVRTGSTRPFAEFDRQFLVIGWNGVDVSTNPVGFRAGLQLEQPENKAQTGPQPVEQLIMAGHSHSANIAHRKGRVDKARGALFGKLSRAIIVAARNGGGDPATNLALRYAIDKARKSSMPKDNIERAVKKGTGDLEGEEYVELTYEGYGPGGVAVMCDALTDNRNRTAGELRKTFEVHGGNLGAAGCVAWMFERKGLFTVASGATSEDALFELALEAGADDVQLVDDVFEVTCPPEDYQTVSDALEAAGIDTDVSELTRIPANKVEVDAGVARKLLKLLDALDENEDVQSVTANYDIPESILAEVLSEE